MQSNEIKANMRLMFYNPRCPKQHMKMITVVQTFGFSNGPIIRFIIRFDDGLEWLCYFEELRKPDDEQIHRDAYADKYL